MLIDQDTIGKINRTIDGLVLWWETYLLGRGGTIPQTSRLTPLEQAYLIGKLSATLGTKMVRNLTDLDISRITAENNLFVSEADRVELDQLKSGTSLFLKGRGEEWKRKVGLVVLKANEDWRQTIERRVFNDQGERTEARRTALDELWDSFEEETGTFLGDFDRILQTETISYLQRGLVRDLSPETVVYKIPRPAACRYCLDLHLNPDGSPKLHFLNQILKNNNLGEKSYNWQFTVGATHPYCYCLLYISAVDPPPGSNLTLAEMKLLANPRSKRK